MKLMSFFLLRNKCILFPTSSIHLFSTSLSFLAMPSNGYLQMTFSQ
uniref:Uncharacterized protein n=1 Tax=Arundo donax TaxID=35708 RepID=A0A0A9D0G4_ARUDO